MSVTDELVSNAQSYEKSFDAGDLPLPPAKRVAIVACMDARLNPYGLLGLREGDAHVIRNAGGVITDDEIRSLSISQRLLGTEARAGVRRETEEPAQPVAAGTIMLLVSNQQTALTITSDTANRELKASSIAQIEFGSAGPEAIDRI